MFALRTGLFAPSFPPAPENHLPGSVDQRGGKPFEHFSGKVVLHSGRKRRVSGRWKRLPPDVMLPFSRKEYKRLRKVFSSGVIVIE